MKPIPKTLTALAEVTEATGEKSRTITGRFISFAADSANGHRIAADGFTARQPLSRVKMLVDHDQQQPVGYMTNLDVAAETAEFYIAEGEAGDKALDDAAKGLRDGLSIGALIHDAHYDEDDDLLIIDSCELLEVSLCAIPAYADAGVTKVAASTALDHTPTPRKEHTMNTGKKDRLTAADAAAADAAAAQPNPAADPEKIAAGLDPEDMANRIAAAMSDGHRQAPAPATTQPRGRSLADVTNTVANAVANGRHDLVRDALSDVVPADDSGEGYMRPDWIGELWQADKTERPLIDALGTPKPLKTGSKLKGWKWDTKPEVDKYDGNKKAIPSNKVKTVPAEAPVKRAAGGWDIDRIYLDLGEPGFLEAFWTAAVASYKVHTEEQTLEYLLDKITPTDLGVTDLLGTLGKLGARFARLGASMDSIFIAPDLFEQYAALTQAEVPFWLANATGISLKNSTATVGDLNVKTLPTLADGDVIAIDQRAADFYEKNPPVRVNAVDLPKGGIDLGLFGYHGTLISDDRAIVRASLAADDGGGDGSGDDGSEA